LIVSILCISNILPITSVLAIGTKELTWSIVGDNPICNFAESKALVLTVKLLSPTTAGEDIKIEIPSNLTFDGYNSSFAIAYTDSIVQSGNIVTLELKEGVTGTFTFPINVKFNPAESMHQEQAVIKATEYDGVTPVGSSHNITVEEYNDSFPHIRYEALGPITPGGYVTYEVRSATYGKNTPTSSVSHLLSNGIKWTGTLQILMPEEVEEVEITYGIGSYDSVTRILTLNTPSTTYDSTSPIFRVKYVDELTEGQVVTSGPVIFNGTTQGGRYTLDNNDLYKPILPISGIVELAATEKTIDLEVNFNRTKTMAIGINRGYLYTISATHTYTEDYENLELINEIPDGMYCTGLNIPARSYGQYTNWSGNLNVEYTTNLGRTLSKDYTARSSAYRLTSTNLELQPGEYIIKFKFTFENFKVNDLLRVTPDGDQGSNISIMGYVGTTYWNGTPIEDGDQVSTVKAQAILDGEVLNTNNVTDIKYTKTEVATAGGGAEFVDDTNSITSNNTFYAGNTGKIEITISSSTKTYGNANELKNPTIWIALPNEFSVENTGITIVNVGTVDCTIGSIEEVSNVGIEAEGKKLYKIQLLGSILSGEEMSSNNSKIYLPFRISEYTLPGKYTLNTEKTFYISSDYQSLTNQWNSSKGVKDTYDFDGDFDLNENLMTIYVRNNIKEINIITTGFGLFHRLKATNEATWQTSYVEGGTEVVSNFEANDTGTYEIIINNSGVVGVEDFVHYEMLPRGNDSTEPKLVLTGPITVPAGFAVEYTIEEIVEKNELTEGVDTKYTSSVVDYSTVTGYKIKSIGVISSGTNETVEVPVKMIGDAKDVNQIIKAKGEYAFKMQGEIATTAYEASTLAAQLVNLTIPPTITLNKDIAAITKDNITITADIEAIGNTLVIAKYLPGSKIKANFDGGANGELLTGFTATEVTTGTFEVSENGTYTVYTKDDKGLETVKTITINNIDKEDPTIVLSQDPVSGTWTNSSVEVIASLDGTGSKVVVGKYMGGTKTAGDFTGGISGIELTGFVSGTTASGTFEVTGNGTYTVYTKDEAGNEAIEVITINNIDKEDPTIVLSQDPVSGIWTNSNVEVTANLDGTGSKVVLGKYMSGTKTAGDFTGGTAGTELTGFVSGTIASGSFEVSENGTYTVYTKDEAGNEIVEVITISNIDKVAPTIVVVPDSSTISVSKDITITVGDTGGAGLLSTNEYEYQIGTSDTVLPTESFITYISGTPVTIGTGKTGTYYLWIKQISDNAGNLSDETQDGYKVVGQYIFDNGEVVVDSIKVTAPETGIYKEGQKITIEVKLSKNVIGTVPELKIDFGTGEERTIATGSVLADIVTYEYSLQPGDNGLIEIKELSGGTLEDALGNTVTLSVMANSGKEITADTLLPTIILSQDPVSGTWTNSNVEVTANLNGTGSKVVIGKYMSGTKTAGDFIGGTELTGFVSGTTVNGTFEVTENGEYTVYTKDEAGNETVEVITISNIDKEDPTIVLNQDPVSGTWTNSNVEVTASLDGTGSKVVLGKYMSGTKTAGDFIGGTEGTEITGVVSGITASGTFEVSENGTYTVYTKDEAGNETVEVITIGNIDKEDPTIVLSQDPASGTWTNSKVEVTANLDGTGSKVVLGKYMSGAKTVEDFTGGTAGTDLTGFVSGTTASGSFEVSENGTYTVYTKDEVGNEDIEVITISNIEKIDPTIILTLDVSIPTNSKVEVTASLDGTGSKVVLGKYMSGTKTVGDFTGGTAGTELAGVVSGITASGTFEVTGNGIYTVYTKDEAGNEAIEVITISNIEKIDPTIILTPDVSIPTNSNVEVTADLNGTGSKVVVGKYMSGTKTVEDFAGGTKGIELTGFTSEEIASGTFEVTGNGAYTVYTKDEAGNEVVEVIAISNIDKVVPTIVLTPDSTIPTKDNVEITVDLDGTGSKAVLGKHMTGIKTVEDFTGGTAGTDLTGFASEEIASGTFEVTENGAYTVYVKDEAGNETVEVITISNIDREAPIITLNKEGTEEEVRQEEVTVRITDNISGVKITSSRYIWSEKETGVTKEEIEIGHTYVSGSTIQTPAEKGNYYLYLIGEDKLGNTQIRRSEETFKINPIAGLVFDLGIKIELDKLIVNGVEKETDLKYEIRNKEINNTELKAVYKITVENMGNVEGYAKEILSIIPYGFELSGDEINTKAGWRTMGQEAYTEVLAQEKLLPGDMKEIYLILKWNSNAENMGTFEVITEISKTENPYEKLGLMAKENHRDRAELIVSPATGGVSISIYILICIGICLVASAKILKKKRNFNNISSTNKR